MKPCEDTCCSRTAWRTSSLAPTSSWPLKADRLLWLDLEGTDDEVLTLLHEVFKIHPLAVEDVKEFHQRPKIEDSDDFVSFFVYGTRGLGEPLTEVHCFYAERFLVTIPG